MPLQKTTHKDFCSYSHWGAFTKMKVERIPLSGGIGNQLFQVAASFYFGNLQKREIVLTRNIGSSVSDSEKHASLDSLRLPITITNNVSESNLFYRLDRKLIKVFDAYADFRGVQVQREVGFDPEFKVFDGTRELRGYFQSFKYVDNFKTIFESAVNRYSGSQFFCESKILAEKVHPVSLHIRRGDYEMLKGTHGILNNQYYESSLQILGEYHNFDKIWVFSDEPEKARNTLRKSKYFDDMDFRIGSSLNSIETLVMMTLCRGHIIANSTFSWWGAILSKLEKSVIAPQEWFFNGSSPSELLPASWLQNRSSWES